MATQNLAVFKYRHDDSLVTPLGAVARILAFLALVSLFIFWVPSIGGFLFFAGIFVLIATWPKRRLVLGARYFLCGNTVVYYANVRKMELRPGNLTLRSEDGEVFTLDWERFPTKARKEQKILNNKNAKFDKVSKGIIRRVLDAAPNVECRGIDRAEWTS